jgi:hypothetical protein
VAESIHIQTVGPRDHSYDGHSLPEERCPQTGKRRYLSEGSALTHAARFADQTTWAGCHAYACPHCGDWHLTRAREEARGG